MPFYVCVYDTFHLMNENNIILNFTCLPSIIKLCCRSGHIVMVTKPPTTPPQHGQTKLYPMDQRYMRNTYTFDAYQSMITFICSIHMHIDPVCVYSKLVSYPPNTHTNTLRAQTQPETSLIWYSQCGRHFFSRLYIFAIPLSHLQIFYIFLFPLFSISLNLCVFLSVYSWLSSVSRFLFCWIVILLWPQVLRHIPIMLMPIDYENSLWIFYSAFGARTFHRMEFQIRIS